MYSMNDGPMEFPETAPIRARWKQLASAFCTSSTVASEWSRASEDLLIARLGQRVPNNIIDLACGVGDPTIRLAAEYPQARVVGVDFVDEMLVELARRAEASGLMNVEARTADLLGLPFADGEFDTVTARFGIQYYSDEIKARVLSEAARVSRPGAVAVFVDWGVEGHGPLKDFYMDVLSRYEQTAHANDASTPFVLKTDAELAALVEAAGFRHVEHGYPEVRWHWAGSPAALWDLVVKLAPQLVRLMSELEPKLAREINARITAGLSKYSTGAGVTMPVRNVIVSGVR
jgi:ubiquinone/menaquinone biosynthesis C-methylase UbiE